MVLYRIRVYSVTRNRKIIARKSGERIRKKTRNETNVKAKRASSENQNSKEENNETQNMKISPKDGDSRR